MYLTHDNSLTIECEETVTTAAINKFCFEKGIVLSQLNLKRKSLETRFLEITGNTKRPLIKLIKNNYRNDQEPANRMDENKELPGIPGVLCTISYRHPYYHLYFL